MTAVLANAGFAIAKSPAIVLERPPEPPMLRNNALMDALFRNVTRFFAFLVFSLLAAILMSLLIGSSASIGKFGLDVFWTENWDPVRDEFGALVPIVGTVATSAIALLIAIPVS